MDETKKVNQVARYIPPHRRQQQPVNDTPPIAHAVNSWRNRQHGSAPNSNRNRSYTAHALVRQEQRGIQVADIEDALKGGEAIPSGSATTYVNEHTTVVQSHDNRIITVMSNPRNTRFNFLRTSNTREEKLIRDVKVNGNDHAMCELAELYLSGNLGNREVKKAYELLLRAANRGNSHAMCLIAKLYKEGDLGKVDLAKESEWLEKAAEHGNKYATAIMGQRYLSQYRMLKEKEEKSEECKVLLQKSIKYLQKSAAKGGTRAMWHLALIHEEGWTGEIDLNKAIQIYSEAAKIGSPNSLYKLQSFVAENKITSDYFENILEIASNFIARTSSGLAVEIGYAQILGDLGTNKARGFVMLKQVARMNNQEAIKLLAKCYRDGIGCVADPEQSYYWFGELKRIYEQAIKQGNIAAILDLGDLYLKGALGKIDLVNAEKLFIQAADHDDIDAIYYLGTLYIEGRLGDHPLEKGQFYINKAISLWTQRANEGDKDAIENLVDLFSDKELGFKNYRKCAYWLSILAKKNGESLSELMYLYTNKKFNVLEEKESQENAEIKDQGIFSQEIIARIKNIATKHKSLKALLVLTKLYAQGYLPKETSTDVNPWAKKLKNILHTDAQKDAGAALFWGYLCKEGEVFPRNIQEATESIALALCLESSESQDAGAINQLEKLISEPHSTDEATQIMDGLLVVANQAEKKARFPLGRILGDIYRKGQLVEIDFKSAIHWYEIAAQAGNSKAMYQLGILYQTGYAANTPNLERAIYWLEKSVQEENDQAAECMKKLLASNKLSPEYSKKIIAALHTYQQKKTAEEAEQKQAEKPAKLDEAESRENPIYRFKLGKQYLEGSADKKQDYLQAAFWFKKAANKRHKEATFELAKLYESGHLGQHIRPVAARFYKIAAKKAHLGAVKALIRIYEQGEWLAADPSKIAKWKNREKNIEEAMNQRQVKRN